MKKKLLLGILAATLAFVGLNGVKADAPEKMYPYYGDGSTILWDNTNHMRCDHVYGACKEYIVSEDGSIEDDAIKLTNGSEVLDVSKTKLSGGYVLTTTKDTGIYYLTYDSDPSEVDGFVNITYYDIDEDLSNYIEGANWNSDHGKYAYIVSNPYYYISVDDNITLNKNVSIHTSMLYANKIINNGRIATGAVYSNEISGNGNIILDYRVIPYGPTAFEADYLALRFYAKQISGVTVDLKGDIKDGTEFGFAGFVNNQYQENITKENAQKIIDMLNNVKGNSLKGYKVVLDELTDVPSGTKMYIGVLKKETESNSQTTNTKNKVKNPKTGDTLFKILGAITLAGAGFVVTVKKAKQK